MTDVTNRHSTRLARHRGRPGALALGTGTHAGTAELRLVTPLMTSPAEGSRCQHCRGTGKEPGPVMIEFSRSGETRGEQSRMAEAIGSSPSMVSMIFSGERAPGVLTLIRIARYLGTTVDRVLKIPAIWRRVHQEPTE